MHLQIDQLAIHFIDPANKVLLYSQGAEAGATLSPEIVKFLLRLVNEVVDADDSGATYSAKFLGVGGLPGVSLVDRRVQDILNGKADFFEASKDLASHLSQVSTASCSAGVLAVIWLSDPDDQRQFVCLLKIRYEDRDFVALTDTSLTKLIVEKIEHLLLEGIQKGAIIPHPTRGEYNLKLIDKQIAGEPARYFKEAFLGCQTKVSDENQVRGIIAALTDYAREKKIVVQKENIPRLIVELQETRQDIKTSALVEAAASAAVFEPPVEKETLSEYIEEKSNIGPVDIPRQSFSHRGKKGRESRQIRYCFSDPQFQGVVLSGPADVLSELLSIDGDTVSFTIKTTRNGFKVEYD